MKKLIFALALLSLAFTSLPRQRHTHVDLDAVVKVDSWVWDMNNNIGVSLPKGTAVHVSEVVTPDGTHYNCLIDWVDASYSHLAWIACTRLSFSP